MYKKGKLILLIIGILILNSCSPYSSIRMKMKYGTDHYPCEGVK